MHLDHFILFKRIYELIFLFSLKTYNLISLMFKIIKSICQQKKSLFFPIVKNPGGIKFIKNIFGLGLNKKFLDARKV